MYSLVLLTALAQPAPPAPPSSTQPIQLLARIDKGNLTITTVTSLGSVDYGNSGCKGYAPATIPATVPATAPVKVKVTTVMVTTMELPAKDVEAYSVDGKKISAETLATLLAKDRPVLVATDGKKVDPFLLQLYKEGTIVLVPPANTLNMSPGVGGPGGPSYSTPYYGGPPTGEKIPERREDKKPPSDRRDE
jgi:hypothetical protein